MKRKPSFDAAPYVWSQQTIAHTALTNSKRAECFVKGVYPTHLTKGHGCHVWDTQGNQYVDFICGLGSNILGYANAEVNEAIFKAARDGANLSLGTPLEMELADRLKGLFPFVDRWRFLKTGSDACSAAIKIARAYKQAKREGNL